MSNILTQGLNLLNFSNEQINSIVPKIEQYIKELCLFNSAYNLVNTDNHDKIVICHILDSLAATTYIKEQISILQNDFNKNDILIADIGSGGGLPGIPLAIAMPENNFILIERMSKRCAFLENVIAILGLKNVTVKNLEAEKVQKGSIDVGVFRAFRPLDKKMIKTLLNMISKDGILIAYKAKAQKIQEEMSAINYEKNSYSVIPLSVPFLTDEENSIDETRERNLVLIKNSI